MLGYFGDQRATEQLVQSRRLVHDRRLGTLDAAGCCVVGRKKDIIVRGGRNIHPGRIEDFARAHPAVLKAAAFPVSDTRLGEKVCLAVELRADAALDPMDLLDHLARRGLSKYDMPEYYLALDALPLTPSGKILKRALADQTKNGVLIPVAVRWTDKGLAAAN